MNTSIIPARALSCSPRANGNSDKLAALFARGFAEAGGNIEVTLMRQYEVRPCVSCYRCQHDPNGWCFLEGTDRSAPLFSMLQEAPALFFAAPVFFYHLPAMFKAFIDRGQSYWLRREAGDPLLLSLPRRTAWVALVAGRKKGEHIFDGSLLTLRYFLAAFNITLAEPLLLAGYDGPDDIANDPATCARVLEYGGNAARAMFDGQAMAVNQ